MSAQLLEALASAPPVRAAGPGARVVVFRGGTVVVVPPAEAARAGSAADPLAGPPPPLAWLAPGGARAAAARRARAAAGRAAQAAGDPFVRRAFDLLLAGGAPAPGTPEARPEVAPLGAAPGAWAAAFPRLRHSALVFNLAVAAAPGGAAAAAARARARDALAPEAILVVADGVAARLAP
jgi:hypothetical protein